MEEVKDVPGYEGLYKIDIRTKEGQCFSIRTGKYLSNQHSERDGRNYWGLFKDGKQVRQQAARWIAITFPELIENEYFDDAEIDHKDTDRMNNHPSNLRWVTSKGNSNNPLTVKHNAEAHIGVFVNHPKLSKEVQQYSIDGEYIATYPSVSEASRQTGINLGDIASCCRKRKHCHTAGGYIWEYSRNDVN